MTTARRWLTLSPEQKREALRRHAEHLLAHAQAKRWVRAHPPRRAIPGLALRFGSLNAILEPDPHQAPE